MITVHPLLYLAMIWHGSFLYVSYMVSSNALERYAYLYSEVIEKYKGKAYHGSL